MWKCVNCKNDNPEDAEYCKECGFAQHDDFVYGRTISKVSDSQKRDIIEKKSIITNNSNIPLRKEKDKDAGVRQEQCYKPAEDFRVEEERRIASEKAANRKAMIIIAVIALVIAVVLVITAFKPMTAYNSAKTLYDNGRYEEAITAFEALDGYSDSAEQIENCKTAIKDREYESAVALMDSGDYEGAITAFEALDGYSDSVDQIYTSATELMNEGNITEAYEAFKNLGEYKDSESICESLLTEDSCLELKAAMVGDVVTFGSYEQDNNLSNGKEKIEWRVLAAEDNRVLLISKYALDCQLYNSSWTKVTWETCTLRTWLNSTFLDNAFSTAEQELIETATVTADKNPEYSTDPGKDTQDRVFLLSITEVNEYFASDDDRMCAATAYAAAQGAYTTSIYKVDGLATCWWWLRSPGYHSPLAASVLSGGSVYFFGNSVNDGLVAIRPALWINLES